jgi:hypothetical protein
LTVADIPHKFIQSTGYTSDGYKLNLSTLENIIRRQELDPNWNNGPGETEKNFHGTRVKDNGFEGVF